MKTLIKTTAAAIALTAVIAGPASAAVSQSALKNGMQSVIGGESNIFIAEDDGVVTITGYYKNALDKNAAANFARNTDGVTEVIDLAFQNN